MRGLIALTVVFGIVLLAMVMPNILNAVRDFRTELLTEEYNVSTAVGQDNATVTLSSALWNNLVAHADVSSNNTADSPVAHSYASASRALTVTGLSVNSSHQLSVEYRTAGLTDYEGAETVSTKIPLFLWGVIILVPVAALIYALKRRA